MFFIPLKKRRDYVRVAQFKVSVKSSSLIVACAPSKKEAGSSIPPRIGFTASRRVGCAVKRNKAKRRMKEAARILFKKEVFPSNSFDWVLIALPKTVEALFRHLEDDLVQGLLSCLERYREKNN